MWKECRRLLLCCVKNIEINNYYATKKCLITRQPMLACVPTVSVKTRNSECSADVFTQNCSFMIVSGVISTRENAEMFWARIILFQANGAFVPSHLVLLHFFFVEAYSQDGVDFTLVLINTFVVLLWTDTAGTQSQSAAFHVACPCDFNITNHETFG